jgi:hypothetical protein
VWRRRSGSGKVPRLEGEGRDCGQRVYIAEGEGSHFSRRGNPRGEAGRSLGRGLMQQRIGRDWLVAQTDGSGSAPVWALSGSEARGRVRHQGTDYPLHEDVMPGK